MTAIQSRLIAGIIATYSFAPAPIWADRVNDNLQIMLTAARQLHFDLPDERAFLLVKQETTVAPVAVIFGYADNAAACEACLLYTSPSPRD